MKDDDLLWDILFMGLFMVLLVLIVPTFSGCTTHRFKPKCVCDCKANSSHFECTGSMKKEKLGVQ